MTIRICRLALAAFAAWGLGAASAQESAAEPGPTLGQFLEDAARNHPRLEEARAELDAAEARGRANSRPLYNPEFEGEFSDSEDDADDSRSIGLSKAFDITNKRATRAKGARSAVDAASFAYEAEKRALFAELLTALADYQARKRLSDLAAERADVAREFSSIADRRAEAGDLSKSERLAARLSFSQAIAEQTTARSEFSEARQALTALVGEVMPAWPVLPDPPAAAPPLDMTLVRRLPELRAAEARADALSAEIRFAKKARIPDPTIGAAYGREGDADFAGVRLSVPIPVFASGQAEVDEARAERIAAEQAIRNQLRNAEARLVEASGRFAVAAGTWRAWMRDGSDVLGEQRRVLDQLWRSGDITAVEYLVQLDQTYSAERAGIELQGSLWRAWIDWLDASGTLNEWMETL
ncbi:TolC family protein [Marinicaulis aureus]|uniref:TolC family protein n=1 Tax=Hyphococcus aureus TaxID=2666033 RepID=A0ABW1KZM9_9PROT